MREAIYEFIKKANLGESKETKNGKDIKLRRCPFCTADDWSFSISVERGGFWCNHRKSCQAQGSFRNLQAQVLGGIVSLGSIIHGQSSEEKPTLQTLYRQHDDLLRNSAAMDYLLKKRGIEERAIKHFRLILSQQIFIDSHTKDKIKLPCIGFPHFSDENTLDTVLYRTLPPHKIFKQAKGGTHVLFNQAELVGKHEITITEGQFDAMILWQKISSPTHGVGSLPQGANTFKPQWAEIFNGVNRINVCFDNDVGRKDNPGQSSAKRFSEMFGLDRCYNIILQSKDANDFFREVSDAEAIYTTLHHKARLLDIEGIKSIGDLISNWSDKDREDERHLQTQWNEINAIWRGFTDGDLMVVSAAEKIGKSNWVWNLLHFFAENKKIPSLYFGLENSIRHIARRLVSIVCGFPSDELTDYDFKKIAHRFPQDLPLFVVDKDVIFRPSLESLCHLVRRTKLRYGIQVFCFDHVQYLLETGKVEEQDSVIKTLKALCNETGVRFILVAHKAKSGGPKDWGASHTRGSRMIQAVSDCNVTLNRKRLDVNADATKAIYEPQTWVEIESRKGSGRCCLYYEETTGRFLSMEKDENIHELKPDLFL